VQLIYFPIFSTTMIILKLIFKNWGGIWKGMIWLGIGKIIGLL